MSGVGHIMSVHGLGLHAASGQSLLEDVTFDVATGSVLAIAGPNGAGKTTLLNLMAGLNQPTSGSVMLDGRDLTVLSPMERARRMAIVSQHSEPDGRLSLRDYVALGQLPILAEHSVAEHLEALQDVLAVTGLSSLAHKAMGQLSGGEKQRAHIARALVQKPELLFLDEPTNHLDPDAKGRVLSLVTAMGITVVMVIHDLVMIPEFATHVAFLKDARLTHFGSVDEVQTPQAVRDTFGVDYRLFQDRNRQIPALDIQKTQTSIEGARL